jgi:Zn finger protein HypA/HybF involved in hydrogenase expression
LAHLREDPNYYSKLRELKTKPANPLSETSINTENRNVQTMNSAGMDAMKMTERERQNKWHEVFYALQREGHSSESAAKIATSKYGHHSDTERTREDHKRTYEHLRRKAKRDELSEREIFTDLADEIYRILVAEGMSTSRAARFAQKLKMRARMKGTDDGQYYREPLQVNLPSRRTSSQPQQKPAGDILGRQSKPGRGNVLESIRAKITCPYCGHPSLSEETNIDSLLGAEKRWRCAFCYAYLTEQELVDNMVLEDMTETFMGNTSTQPVSIPNWTPKDIECPYCKSKNIKIMKHIK